MLQITTAAGHCCFQNCRCTTAFKLYSWMYVSIFPNYTIPTCTIHALVTFQFHPNCTIPVFVQFLHLYNSCICTIPNYCTFQIVNCTNLKMMNSLVLELYNLYNLNCTNSYILNCTSSPCFWIVQVHFENELYKFGRWNCTNLIPTLFSDLNFLSFCQRLTLHC